MPAFTTDQYNTLTAAIAQGALMVMYGNKQVTYRSLKDMLELKELMETELGLNGTSSNNGRKFASFSKGLQ